MKLRCTLLLALALTLTACASSSSRSEDGSDEAAEATEQAEQQQAEREEAEREPAKPPVEPRAILALKTSDGMPPGCEGNWSELGKRKYKGTLYACEKFRTPERFKDATVVIGVTDNEVRRVSMQLIYDSASAAESAYDSLSEEMYERCAREGGTPESIGFKCEDYYANLSVRKQQGFGQVVVVLGVETWDLPH